MNFLEATTPTILNKLVDARDLSRARSYVERVEGLEQTDNTLQATVCGARSYRVELKLDGDRLTASCTCTAQLSWTSFCRHFVALAERFQQLAVPAITPEELDEWLRAEE